MAKRNLAGAVLALAVSLISCLAVEASSISVDVKVQNLTCTLGSLVPVRGENYASVAGEAYYPYEHYNEGTSFSTSPASYSYDGYWLEEMTSKAAYDLNANQAAMSCFLVGKAPDPLTGNSYLWERSICTLILTFNVTEGAFYSVTLTGDYTVETQVAAGMDHYFHQVSWIGGIGMHSTFGPPGTSWGNQRIVLSSRYDSDYSLADYDSGLIAGEFTSQGGPFWVTPGSHFIFVELEIRQTGHGSLPNPKPIPLPSGFLLVSSGLGGIGVYGFARIWGQIFR